MRTVRLLAASTIFIISLNAGRAETAAAHAIGIMKQVCLSPGSPADIMASADRMAARDGWILDTQRSGPHRGADQRADQTPFFIDKFWQIQDPNAIGRLGIRIMAPAYPDERMTTCMIKVSGRLYEQFNAEAQAALTLGTGHGGPPAADRVFTTWPLSGDFAHADDGVRSLTISMQKQADGWSTDVTLMDVKSHNGMLAGEKF